MTPLRLSREDEADRHWAFVSAATQQASGRGVAAHRRAATWVGLALIRAGSVLISVGPADLPGPPSPLTCEA
jgi:hypothetical protein